MPIEVQGETENTVSFSSLRSTAKLISVSLVDPSGKVIWKIEPEALGFVPRAQTRDPERGDAIALPQVRDARPGTWRLDIEATTGRHGAGSASFAYTVFDRFGLTMHVGTSSAYAGEPVLVTLRPTDHGEQIAGIEPIRVAGLNVAGHTAVMAEATERPKTPEGISLTDEPGTYIATLRFDEPGTYKLVARTSATGGSGVKESTASQSIIVGGRAGGAGLLRIREQVRPGRACVERMYVDFEVWALAAGRYTLNLSFAGRNGKAIRLAKGFEVPAGKAAAVVQSVVVEGKDLELDKERASLLRLALLRVDAAEIRVVDEQLSVPLDGIESVLSRTCR